MLRALVVLLLLVNVALFGWLRTDPQILQADREPQRLQQQVSPDAVRVLPDQPASTVAPASSTPNVASLALAATGTDIGCAETPPLDGPAIAALSAALVRAGVPADALVERRQLQGGSWIVYLGRFADPKVRQQRADELTRLDLKFEPVNAPAALAPGLSLGRFSNRIDAGRRVEELLQQSVHGARVVAITPPAVQRHLQVHATDPAWRGAAGKQAFQNCPLDSTPGT